LTRSDEIFLTQKVKIEKFGIFKGNFPNLEVADPTRPTRATKKMTLPNPGQKFLTVTHR